MERRRWKGLLGEYAENGSFTNIRGTVFYGHRAFEDRHIEIFRTFFKGSKLAMSPTQISTTPLSCRTPAGVVQRSPTLTPFTPNAEVSVSHGSGVRTCDGSHHLHDRGGLAAGVRAIFDAEPESEA